MEWGRKGEEGKSMKSGGQGLKGLWHLEDLFLFKEGYAHSYKLAYITLMIHRA